jgi:Ima1 N-terminal domain
MCLPQIPRPYSTPESSPEKRPREHPMAPLLRKKLVCFYCSQASSRRQDGTVREWLCKKCDAVNYLDQVSVKKPEHVVSVLIQDRTLQAGQPTFPPALYGSSSPQDAPPILRPASQSLDPSPFCATCLRNQHLRTEVLANYMPEDLLETGAEYKAYEANYPSYLKEVDERYPQVCAECEPKVRKIMSTRHHAVKADNLRRVMDRSKNRTRGQPLKTDWRELLILIGAFCYWASIGIQLIWNSMGALAAQGPEVEMRDEASSSVLFKYLQTSIWEQHIPRQLPGMCSVLVAPLAGWSLVLGLASLWWNPQLKTKLYWRRARMTGLNDYYKLQIIVNVARFVGWEILQDPDLFGIKSSIHWAIHLVMFALTALVRLIFAIRKGHANFPRQRTNLIEL